MRKKTVSMLVCFLLLLTGCAPINQVMNRRAISKIDVGMTKDEVKEIAGQPDLMDTSKNIEGNILLVYYYYTDRKHRDGQKTRDECSPIIFKDNVVIGIGQEYLLMEEARAKRRQREKENREMEEARAKRRQREKGNRESEKESVSVGTAWPCPKGYIVTNYHVVKGRANIYVVYNERRIPVQIAYRDVHNDIVLLKAKGSRTLPKALPLGSGRAKLGSEVFTVGYPHIDVMGISPKVTSGTISSLAGLQDDPRFYQITVSVQAGNSGGPLLNMRGEVVGIVTSKINAVALYKWTGDLPQNVNYATKTAYVWALLDSVEEEYPYDGVHEVKEGSLEGLTERIKKSILVVVAE